MEKEVCVTGCVRFYGGEIRHHKDCPFYEGSLSKLYDDAKREAETLALSLWKEYYKETSPNFGLCFDVGGIILQINNMVAGITEKESFAHPISYKEFVILNEINEIQHELREDNCDNLAIAMKLNRIKNELEKLFKEKK